MGEGEAGIEDFTFHNLRHTYATWLARPGSALHIVQDQLGHGDPKVTRKYLHVFSTDLQKANEQLPRLGGPVPAQCSGTLKEAK